MDALKKVPQNFGPMKMAEANLRLTGPCGDSMEFWLRIRKDKIIKATFTTDGCKNSMACGSTAAALIEGLSPAQALKIKESQILEQVGPMSENDEHCATLALGAIQAALHQYDQKRSAQTIQRPSEKTNKDRSFKTLLVVSGKGGVGKSTVAVQLALYLGQVHQGIGLLDADLHGPSVPVMLGMEGVTAQASETGILPHLTQGVQVLSAAMLYRQSDHAVTWRGPRKSAILKQFLEHSDWQDLQLLIVDAPPGTGDELLTLAQEPFSADGVIVVTTPQNIAISDVKRCLRFCKENDLPVLGIVENMSGHACPHCGEQGALFQGQNFTQLEQAFPEAWKLKIPFHEKIGLAAEQGQRFQEIESMSEQTFGKLAKRVAEWMKK